MFKEKWQAFKDKWQAYSKVRKALSIIRSILYLLLFVLVIITFSGLVLRDIVKYVAVSFFYATLIIDGLIEYINIYKENRKKAILKLAYSVIVPVVLFYCLF